MNIQQVNSAIMFGTWTDTELASMIDAIKFARANLQKTVKNTLRIGDIVKWNSTKHRRVIHGRVSKIAVKYVTVNAGVDGNWKVPANMLEVVDKELV